MLFDGRGEFLVPLKIPGLDADSNSTIKFANDLPSGCLGDCSSCPHNKIGDPVKTNRVPHKRDGFWIEAQKLVFEELLNVRDNLDFYKYSQNEEGLKRAILRVQFLLKEIDEGYKNTIERLQLNEKDVSDDITDSLNFNEDIFNPWETFKSKIGIKPVSLDGWHR